MNNKIGIFNINAVILMKFIVLFKIQHEKTINLI